MVHRQFSVVSKKVLTFLNNIDFIDIQANQTDDKKYLKIENIKFQEGSLSSSQIISLNKIQFEKVSVKNIKL